MDMRRGAMLRRQLGYYNPREVADQLGVNFWTYYDYIERGLVRRPMAWLGKSRYYTRNDLDQIKEQFETRIEK